MLNILYCGDKNMEKGLFLSALSLTRQTDEALHIYILTMSLKTESKYFEAMSVQTATDFRLYLKGLNPNHEVSLIDMTEAFQADLPTANMTTRFTPYCMLRLYADLVPEMPDRVLYLDTDVIARKDFTDYYYQDMTDVEVVGTLDYYGRWFFRQSWKSMRNDYLNSGVLLLNMAEIKASNLFGRCRAYCAQKEMFMPDQSALNKLCYRKRIVQRRFNEQRKVHSNTVFQHFTTSFRFFPWFKMVNVKPWEEERVHEELGIYDYDDLYAEYDAVEKMKG